MSPAAQLERLTRTDSIVLLGRGFRPFFMLAALHGALFVPTWAWIALGGSSAPAWTAPALWHAHEMIYGFAGAAAAGFLLTAVPVWTGARPLTGWRLAGLVASWIVARVVLAVPYPLPPLVTSSAALLFPFALLLAVLRPLLQPTQRHNLVFLPVLALLALSAAASHVSAAGIAPTLGPRAARTSVYAMALLVVLVGGRIVPSFTQNALSRRGSERKLRTSSRLDAISVIAVWSVIACTALGIGGPLASVAQLLAALTLAIRLSGWQSQQTLGDPLLWSLHVAFAWLPIGFGLLAASELGAPVPAAAGLHAIGAGCLGGMVLAVMTRVALGHTGRPLIAPRTMTAAYLAVSGGAMLRIASVWTVEARAALLIAGAALWSAAFALFIWSYAPILTSRRSDGKEG